MNQEEIKELFESYINGNIKSTREALLTCSRYDLVAFLQYALEQGVPPYGFLSLIEGS